MFEILMQADLDLSRNLLQYMSERPRINYVFYRIANSNELKGVVSAVIFWFLWFSKTERQSEKRLLLLAMAFSTTVAIFIGIVLAQILPFRQRPRANPDVLGSNAVNSQFFEEWSSMPSDHAVMFFAIATGFFLVSRMAGAFAFLHAMFVVCLDRKSVV